MIRHPRLIVAELFGQRRLALAGPRPAGLEVAGQLNRVKVRAAEVFSQHRIVGLGVAHRRHLRPDRPAAGKFRGSQPALARDQLVPAAEAVRAVGGADVGASVGGSGVGHDLLETVIAAFPHAQALRPDLRMVAVAGPRIDPASLPSHPGLEVRGYVESLHRHLAVCDLAVVQADA